MADALLAHTPAPGAARQLVLLFHGVGSDAPALVPLGRQLARALPDAVIASVPGPDASDLGQGRQWFSVLGVTEANRPARVAATLPRFAETVRALQAAHGIGPQATTLIGFSQGAIMALESASQGLAGRIVALAGRFAQPPQAMPAGVRFHLLHGARDPVIPAAWAAQAEQGLRALGCTVTLDLFPQAGHDIPPAMQELLGARLAAPVQQR